MSKDKLEIALGAIADTLKSRNGKVVAPIHVEPSTPTVKVVNQVDVPKVTVEVDLKPLVAVLEKVSERILTVFEKMQEALTEAVSMQSQMVQVISSMPTPTVENQIDVQPAEVGEITVKADVTIPKRERRRIKVKHGENESIITEE